MNGKSKCKILKDIRKKIAEDNDISYVTSECKYQGECSGTCPKCEAEVRYLEEELAKRRNLGKTVAVAGIATALVVGASGCVLSPSYGENAGAPPANRPTFQTEPSTTEPTTEQPLMGEPAIIDPTQETIEVMGELPADDYTYPAEDLLMGDIVLPEDSIW